MTNTTTKAAAEIQVGDKVVEADGAFFTVTSIVAAGRSLVFGLSDASGCYMRPPTSAKVGRRAQVRVMVEAQ